LIIQHLRRRYYWAERRKEGGFHTRALKPFHDKVPGLCPDSRLDVKALNPGLIDVNKQEEYPERLALMIHDVCSPLILEATPVTSSSLSSMLTASTRSFRFLN